MNRTLLAIFAALLPLTAGASPAGPESYGECMAQEMKGHPGSQTDVAVDICRKRFPALTAFTEPAHMGKLACFSEALLATFGVQIAAESIQAGPCTYAVRFRDSELLKAETNDACRAGASLLINFARGSGSFSDSRDPRQQITFDCQEQKDAPPAPASPPATPPTAGSAEALALSRYHCLACHSLDRRMIGPSFSEISQRRRTEADAADVIERRILAGSVNVWGPVPMPASPSVPQEEARVLAAWIMSLANRP